MASFSSVHPNPAADRPARGGACRRGHYCQLWRCSRRCRRLRPTKRAAAAHILVSTPPPPPPPPHSPRRRVPRQWRRGVAPLRPPPRVPPCRPGPLQAVKEEENGAADRNEKGALSPWARGNGRRIHGWDLDGDRTHGSATPPPGRSCPRPSARPAPLPPSPTLPIHSPALLPSRYASSHQRPLRVPLAHSTTVHGLVCLTYWLVRDGMGDADRDRAQSP